MGTASPIMMEKKYTQQLGHITELQHLTQFGDNIMQKFEPGRIYQTRLITDHDSIIKFYVVSRTDKSVIIKGDLVPEPKRFKIHSFKDEETIFPWGKYSMCPSIDASDEVKL